jgi:demethylmenaquinone methyltransferase/2-methoxy-6-polyprenyl-1,4-benzoquinol methylase
MVAGLHLAPGFRALDVGAGTGSISRLLQRDGAEVFSLDQSPEMLRLAAERGAMGVLATGEALPFADATFDAVTFGYLLRYVHDVDGALAELARVLRRGGRLGMVEFGRPDEPVRRAWRLYTRRVLPAAGSMIGDGWREVGLFLGPSIEDFADRYPPERLVASWEGVGLGEVRLRRMSLGGGLVMWGTRR